MSGDEIKKIPDDIFLEFCKALSESFIESTIPESIEVIIIPNGFTNEEIGKLTDQLDMEWFKR